MRLVTSATPIIKEIGDNDTIIIDTETSSLYPHKDGRILAGIGVKPLGGEGFYLPFRHINNISYPNASLKELMRLYEVFQGRTLVFFNAPFDLAVLWNEGLNLIKEDVIDVLVTMRLIKENEPSYQLRKLAYHHIDDTALEVEKVIKQKCKKMGWGYKDEEGEFIYKYDQIPPEVLYNPYVRNDLYFLDELFVRSMKQIELRDLTELLELEKKVTKALFWMEMRGVKMDKEYINSELDSLSKSYIKFENEIYKTAGKEFNIRSTQQIGEIFTSMGVRSPKLTIGGKNKDKRKPAWDKDVLKNIDHPFAEQIIKYRTVKKYKDYYSNFIKFMTEEDVIHPSFQQAGARTGRFSCREPNLQNIPVFGGDIDPVTGEKYSEFEASLYGKVRNAFVAREDCFLLLVDQSQVELRIFADYADEKDQIKLFDLGLDIHAMVALSAFGSMPSKGTDEYKFRRVIGKNIGFGLRYGLGAKGLGKRIGKTKDEAQAFKDKYFERFPKVKFFMDRVQNLCEARGYDAPDGLGWVKNKWGRRRYLPPELSYVAVNFLIQGTAADLIKDALWRVDEALTEYQAQTEITIHDELFVEVPYSEAEYVIPIVMREMEWCDKSKLSVPIQATPSWSATSWGAKQSFECDTCSGKRKLFSASEEDMLTWLYENNMIELDKVEVTKCEDCDGAGYDISKISRPV